MVETGNDDYISGGPLGNEAADTSNDTLIGGGGADVINGWGGNDSIRAAADGAICTISGGDGNDSVDGGNNSFVYGEAGDDTLFGLGVDARVWVQLEGGDGNDVLSAAGFGNNLMVGGAGADTINGSSGDNTIYDDGFFATISTDADRISAGAGDDAVNWYGGADTIDGGSGFDVLSIDRTSLSTALVFKPKATGVTNTAGGAVSNFEAFQVVGGSGRDKLTGLIADDGLTGNAGNDLLSGGKGNDSLDGGNDNDTLIGGAGADTLIAGSGADTLRWTVLDRRNTDQAFEFSRTSDILEFTVAALDGLLPEGALDPAYFALNAATTAGPQFVFITSTKVLSWDADGTGGGRATAIVDFPNFNPSANLDATDIVIIA